MKLASVRKKTRGMRKKARNLALWAEYHKKLDIDSLMKYRKEYVKIWIDPFYRLYQLTPNKVGKKNPKYRFRKQVLSQLFEIYLAWQEQLDRLEQPYYLKIWLGDPEFMDSHIPLWINSNGKDVGTVTMSGKVTSTPSKKGAKRSAKLLKSMSI